MTVTTSAYRGRFAPSPTGPLHPGSLTAALGSWLLARHAGGRWLVRIEDLDPPREVPGAGDLQLAQLAACGLVPDGPVVRQSGRHAAYAVALDHLVGAGLAFECRCSRSDLAQTAGIHRRCVSRPSGTRPAVRLRVADGEVAFSDLLRGPVSQDVGAAVGDFVLRRADGFWAYQLAVVVDDAWQQITDVVRGADLIDSTPRQILLQRALGLPTPRYGHLPVVRTPDGAKLGKSLGAKALAAEDPLRDLARAYQYLGQDPGVLRGNRDCGRALECALAAFDPRAIPAGDRYLPHI